VSQTLVSLCAYAARDNMPVVARDNVIVGVRICKGFIIHVCKSNARLFIYSTCAYVGQMLVSLFS